MISSFRIALNKAGLATKEKIIADGKLHRFHVIGDKPGSKNGWYVFFSTIIPAGAFGSWKKNVSQKWCTKDYKTFTLHERETFYQQMREAEIQRKREKEIKHANARIKAQRIYDASEPCLSHLYLSRKRVKPHNLRLYINELTIPLQDVSGVIHSLQLIDGLGNKRFLTGGRKKGCYFLIGNPTEALCICEGYATGASIYEATGYPVAVAFDAGNLKPVALAIRKKYPHLKIAICADNDDETDGNPGLTKAKEAALAIGALLAVPPCTGDFNDFYNGAVQ